jgi:ribosomal protein S18 acetylase RimI-like enzyme
MKIMELNSINEHLYELSELLIQVVEDGASIGILPPLTLSEAIEYWENVISPNVILFVAKINKQIVGSVQLHLCTKPNGRHRAEIVKLMIDPNWRNQVIGRSLIQKAEERAMAEGRSLLVLDTKEGDPSNYLYCLLGFYHAGSIPNYAKSADGELHSTNIYYKELI